MPHFGWRSENWKRNNTHTANYCFPQKVWSSDLIHSTLLERERPFPHTSGCTAVFMLRWSSARRTAACQQLSWLAASSGDCLSHSLLPLPKVIGCFRAAHSMISLRLSSGAFSSEPEVCFSIRLLHLMVYDYGGVIWPWPWLTCSLPTSPAVFISLFLWPFSTLLFQSAAQQLGISLVWSQMGSTVLLEPLGGSPSGLSLLALHYLKCLIDLT